MTAIHLYMMKLEGDRERSMEEATAITVYACTQSTKHEKAEHNVRKCLHIFYCFCSLSYVLCKVTHFSQNKIIKA